VHPACGAFRKTGAVMRSPHADGLNQVLEERKIRREKRVQRLKAA
jgi:hypothetical protein